MSLHLFSLRFSTISCLAIACFAATSHAQRAGYTPPSLVRQEQTQPLAHNQEFDIEKAKSTASAPGSNRAFSASDGLKLKRDADELAKLAQSIPGDIDQTTKGMLPQDLDQRLKRIAKLAKELHSGISH